ncbi:MAG: DUF4129 domain-containing protein [Mycobacteriales bacterium]
MRARPRNDPLRLAAAGALVLVLLTGVTLAAAAPRITVDASDVAGPVLLALLLVGLVSTIMLLTRGALVAWRSPYFWLYLLAAIAVVAFLIRRGGTLPPPRAPSASLTSSPSLGELADERSAWPLLLALFALTVLVLAAVRAYIWWADSRDQEPPDAPAMSESALDDAIDAALLDLRGGGDHRRAVIAAYAAAETSLASHGARRLRSESPLEYLDRVVRLLGAKGESVDRLTALYEQARFSDHTIDEAMRDEAIAAFEGLRTRLEDAP